MKKKEILEALQWRYAVKGFDATKKVSDEDFETIIESARLAPSSIGLEPWKFFVIENTEVRAALREAGYGQPQITDASHLIVLAHRTDAAALPKELVARTAIAQGVTEEALAGLQQMAEGATGRPAPEAWLSAQTYIPLGMMLETAALLGVDTCPMEGFDKQKVDEILDLASQNLASTSILAVGYRGEDKYAHTPKTRRAVSDVVTIIR